MKLLLKINQGTLKSKRRAGARPHRSLPWRAGSRLADATTHNAYRSQLSARNTSASTCSSRIPTLTPRIRAPMHRPPLLHSSAAMALLTVMVPSPSHLWGLDRASWPELGTSSAPMHGDARRAVRAEVERKDEAEGDEKPTSDEHVDESLGRKRLKTNTGKTSCWYIIVRCNQ